MRIVLLCFRLPFVSESPVLERPQRAGPTDLPTLLHVCCHASVRIGCRTAAEDFGSSREPARSCRQAAFLRCFAVRSAMTRSDTNHTVRAPCHERTLAARRRDCTSVYVSSFVSSGDEMNDVNACVCIKPFSMGRISRHVAVRDVAEAC